MSARSVSSSAFFSSPFSGSSSMEMFTSLLRYTISFSSSEIDCSATENSAWNSFRCCSFAGALCSCCSGRSFLPVGYSTITLSTKCLVSSATTSFVTTAPSGTITAPVFENTSSFIIIPSRRRLTDILKHGMVSSPLSRTFILWKSTIFL